MVYDHHKIEPKWRKVWSEKRLYQPNLRQKAKGKRQKYYNLMMFPYPSAEGLHVGNMYAFTGSDVWGRYQRMLGHDCFQPIGLDGFGIHSENYAIKVGRHPKEHAKISQEHFYEQLSQIGNGFAWENRLETYDPQYYKWTQWLFVQLYKKGLAYRGKAVVNWCPSCKTVLADEQVEGARLPAPDGAAVGGQVCERCKTEVVKKEMTSWYFKITAYAERLLHNLEKLDWPKKIVTAQRNWIGKSQGHVVRWQMADGRSEIETFTTRVDTLLGVTFLAVAAGEGKGGEAAGYTVIHPVTGEEIPVWVADYVVTDYGTGVVMGVPAGDERDLKFAKTHGLKVKEFEPYVWKGEKFAREEVRYHLRDWLISRQRYWGPPIPMVECSKCGWQAVPEEDLPVVLPEVADWKPIGTGKSPLETAPQDWLYTKCPKCGGKAKRETDVSDTFLDSAWYFLRYPSIRSARSGQAPFDPEITRAWLPVDMYIGGAEHAVLHLLYSRFVWMFLKDEGHLSGITSDEPFPRLFSHGLIIKDGAKMSKSRGNVVTPDAYIDKFGADTLRTYLMFLGPLDGGGDFRDTGIAGMYRFIERVWTVFGEGVGEKTTKGFEKRVHQAIKRATEGIERFKYNTAIAIIMKLVNDWKRGQVKLSWADAGVVCRLLAPFAPFIAEELWQRLTSTKSTRGMRGTRGNTFDTSSTSSTFTSVHVQRWPEWDEEMLVEDKVTIVVQVNGKVRATIDLRSQISDLRSKAIQMAKENEKVKNWIEGKKIVKEVWVPGKLVNLVVK